MKTPLLNEYQQNSLRLTLVYVDKALWLIEQLLACGDEGTGLMYGIKDDLTKEEKALLLSSIPRIREIIREVKEEFALEMQSDDKSRIIFGKLPYLWEILMDTTRRKMKGYGEVAPGLADKLDPPVKAMADLVNKMTKVVEPASREKRQKFKKTLK